MHILMKKQGFLINPPLPPPSLKSVFSWEIWNMDFLYIHTHGTEHCELKMFWGMKCWKCSACFLDSPSPSHLGEMSSLYPFHEFFLKNLCFSGKSSRNWFSFLWYRLLSKATLKSWAEHRKNWPSIRFFKDDIILSTSFNFNG